MTGSALTDSSRINGVDEQTDIEPDSPDGPEGKAFRSVILEKGVLLREIHHRIKNDMAAISSYLSIQADGLPAKSRERMVLLEARSRVDGMMRLYDQLSVSEDFHTLSAKIYLEDLVCDLCCLIPEPNRVRLLSECEDIPMDSRVLFPLGMAINELVTNAIKHAFRDGHDGIVRVTLRRDSPRGIRAAVEDTGTGFPFSADSPSGFGLSLVGALVEQVEGILETTSIQDQGTTFCIRIP